MICFATCAFGLSGLVRDELLALELPVLRVEDARVFFEADRVGVIRANLWLRCADRVFVELGHFPAVAFEQIYDGVRALPWRQLLPRDAAFTVTGKSALSKLFSVRDLQSLTKKAIADALMQAHGLSRCPETGQAYSIEIGMLRDEASVALNTSGPGLNRRGYRDLSAQAPLRETLAAAMVSLAYYHGDETLIDPCCGSGTIVIEAAMIAAHIAPGLLRAFAFDGWKNWQADAQRLREQARAQRRESGFAHLLAYDVDPKAVSMAWRHAKRAGVNGFIQFEQADAADLQLPMERGVIVTNPPYGERMRKEDGERVVRALRRIKDERPQIGVFAISSDDSFESCFGRKADKKRKLYNGNIRCNLYMYMRGRKPRGIPKE